MSEPPTSGQAESEPDGSGEPDSRPGRRRAEVEPARGQTRRGTRAAARHPRTRGLPGTVGMTVIGALIPGTGFLYAGRRIFGWAVLIGWLVVLGSVALYFGRGLRPALDLAFDPTWLKLAAAFLVAALVIWGCIVLMSYRIVRPLRRPRWHTAVGYLTVLVLIAAGGLPVARAAQYAMVQADAVSTVFDDDVDSATVPTIADEENPWEGKDRVNILLLGGDGGEGRTGVRTDTTILMSIDTTTGKTVMFSLPRNMMYAQFPENSPLHETYPDGFGAGSAEDPSNFMLNAIYSQVPERNPGILGKSDNEGADAVKQAVSGSLGVPVDYYLLVNLEGFKEVVDAIGGITVNINERVAINGDTDAGIPPTGYLEPGPDQKLDGFKALWFARGRWGSDDYARMDRQRCAVNALIDAADPQTLLTRYISLAKAGKEIVYTDMPRKLGPAFVELLLKVKDAKVKSVVFRRSEKFEPNDPDYDAMRDWVHRVLNKKKGDGTKKRGEVEAPVDACAYNPVDADAAGQ